MIDLIVLYIGGMLLGGGLTGLAYVLLVGRPRAVQIVFTAAAALIGLLIVRHAGGI